MPSEGGDKSEWEIAPYGRKRDGTPVTEDELLAQIVAEEALLYAEAERLGRFANSDKFQSEEEIWASTHYGGGGPRGSIGVDVAILLSTALLYRTKPTARYGIVGGRQVRGAEPARAAAR